MKKRVLALLVAATILLIAGLSSADQLEMTLNRAKKEGKIVMLELGSVGCIPCEQMKPVMKKLSENYKGKLEVIFVDVKKDSKNAKKYGVFVIPVQVFLDKEGKEFHRHLGYYSYEEIVPVLKKAGL
ncbi:MAG: thioredoxin family protein [Nitrospirota bacterium]